MMTFRIKDHSLRPGVQVVEIFYDGEFIAAIYPSDGRSIGIGSKFMGSAVMAEGYLRVLFSEEVTVPELDSSGG